MRNFILFSLIYVCVFSGYYLTASFLNILYSTYAFWSFVIFYGVYAIGSILSVFIVDKLNPYKNGLKITLFISCITFTIFIGFSGSNIFPLLLIGSAIGGLGNSVIWLVQGTFLESNEMGNFYMLYNINMIFGNLFGLIILLSNLSPQIMILSMTGFSGLGAFLSLFIIKRDIEKEQNLQNEKKESIEIGNIQKLLNIFKSIIDTKWLIVSYIYQAIGLNITYQILPKLLIQTCVETEKMKNIYNVVIFLIYGVFAMGFSWLWGKLFQKDWKYVVIPYSILEICSLIVIFILSKYNTICGYWIVVGALRGTIDYGINNTINMTLSAMKTEEISSHFSLYRFIYAISYLLSSICIGYISYEYVLLICLIFLIVSTFSYFIFQACKS